MRLWPLAPLVCFLAVFFLIPTVRLMSLAFTDEEGGLDLGSFERMVNSAVYFRVILNTFEISAATTLLCIVFGYPVAFVMANVATRWRTKIVLLVMMPFWTGFLVRTFAWLIILGHNGPAKAVLEGLGLISADTSLLHHHAAVLVGMVHALMPLAILNMYAVMERIDASLGTAALTLGARPSQAFWRIYFPLSMPGVAAAGLLVFITSMGFFITPAILGSPQQTMVAQIVIAQVLEFVNWQFAAALSLILLICAATVFFAYDRILGLSSLTGAADPRGGVGGMARLGYRLAGYVGDVSSAIGGLIDRLRRLFGLPASTRFSRPVRTAYLVLALMFLVLPSFFVIPISLNAGTFLDFPPTGFSLRWYREFFSSQIWIGALYRSIWIGLASAALAVALGAAAAYVLVRERVAGRKAILVLILSPLIIPRITVAVAFFFLLASLGLAGTNLGVVIGHTVLAIPYVVVTVMSVLRNFDVRLEHAAHTLGARPRQALFLITLPLIRSGLLASGVFALITSFDDLSIVLFVSGGLQNTLPNQMWTSMTVQASPILGAASTVLLLGITGLILIAEWVGARSRAKAAPVEAKVSL